MPSTAARAFEAAIQKRSASLAKSRAAAQFEDLVKAKRRAPDAMPQSFGRESGQKDASFESVNAFALHGKLYKPVKEGSGIVAVGEDHPMFEASHLKDIKAEKVNNPFEHLMRLGYGMHQKIGGLSAEEQKDITSTYQHPNHDYHLAYVYKLARNVLNPNSSVNRASRAKKMGGISDKERMEHLASGIWKVDNVNEARAQGVRATQLPRSHQDVLSRLESATSDRSKHVEHAVAGYSRGALYTMGLNRMFDAAKKHGWENVAKMTPEQFTDVARRHGNLREFTQSRLIPGFHAGAVNQKAGYNARVLGDLDSKGKPVAQDLSWWKAPEGSTGPKHMGEEMGRLTSLPVADGRSEQVKTSGARVYHDYLTPRAQENLGAYMNAMRKVKP